MTIDVGDTLQVEVTADGEVLTSATLSVRPSADSWRQRTRRLVSSSVVAVVAVLALAILGPRLFADGMPTVLDEDRAAVGQIPPSGEASPGPGGGAPQRFHDLTVATFGDGAGTVSGGGIDCGPTCSTPFAQGTQVTLTAEPADGSVFDGWSGCDDPSSASCTVTMDGDQTVTASFSIEPPPLVTLTVTTSGDGEGTVSGGGIDCGETCGVELTQGIEVTLEAEPADGIDQGPVSTFGGWSDSKCDDPSSTSCKVTMDGDKEITAEFNAIIID